MTSLSEILSFFVGQCLNFVDIKLAKFTQSVETRISQKEFTGMGTWRPKNSFIFTLIKYNDRTYIYCHQNDTLYYAHPNICLLEGCPNDIGFLGQGFMEQNQIRFLVFDILKLPGFPSVEARYECLQTFSQYLPRPICDRQWVGQVKCLTEEFFQQLPHEVDYVFMMEPTVPWVVYRQLKLDTLNILDPRQLRMDTLNIPPHTNLDTLNIPPHTNLPPDENLMMKDTSWEEECMICTSPAVPQSQGK